MPLVILAKPAGRWKSGWRSDPPASMRSTLIDGSSLKRWASTQPAEPPPTMIKSKRLARTQLIVLEMFCEVLRSAQRLRRDRECRIQCSRRRKEACIDDE